MLVGARADEKEPERLLQRLRIVPRRHDAGLFRHSEIGVRMGHNLVDDVVNAFTIGPPTNEVRRTGTEQGLDKRRHGVGGNAASVPSEQAREVSGRKIEARQIASRRDVDGEQSPVSQRIEGVLAKHV